MLRLRKQTCKYLADDGKNFQVVTNKKKWSGEELFTPSAKVPQASQTSPVTRQQYPVPDIGNGLFAVDFKRRDADGEDDTINNKEGYNL